MMKEISLLVVVLYIHYKLSSQDVQHFTRDDVQDIQDVEHLVTGYDTTFGKITGWYQDVQNDVQHFFVEI